MRLRSKLQRMHGTYWKAEDNLEWVQYWVGWRRAWYVGPVRVWACTFVRQDRPMHEFIRNVFS